MNRNEAIAWIDEECTNIDPRDKDYVDAMKAIRDLLATCKHEWADARNQVVKSGEICLKCYAMRAGNTTTTGEEL